MSKKKRERLQGHIFFAEKSLEKMRAELKIPKKDTCLGHMHMEIETNPEDRDRVIWLEAVIREEIDWLREEGERMQLTKIKELAGSARAQIFAQEGRSKQHQADRLEKRLIKGTGAEIYRCPGCHEEMPVAAYHDERECAIKTRQRILGDEA